MPRRLTALLFCLLFFHGLISEWVFRASWELSGEPDSRINQFIFELAVVVTAAWLLHRRPIRVPAGTMWLVLYVGWALLSGLLTSDTVSDGFMYSRYVIYGFVFYLAVWNYPFSTPDLHGLNRLVAALAFVQLAATLVKLFLMHDRTEWRVGTMMIAGGGVATVFPLFALAYGMSYYFYVRRSWWVLLTGLSFALIGYASGKRAIYFVLPAAAVVNLLLYCWLERGRSAPGVLPRFLVHMSLCAALVFPAMLYGIAHSDGIGFSTEGATPSELFQHALDYARGYEYGRSTTGLIAGRSGASEQVLESLSEAPATKVLFGWGPAALMPKRGDALQGGGGFRPLGIAYGIVGWSRDAISIGVPGMAFYLLFMLSLLRATYHRSRHGDLARKWKGMCFGTTAGFLVLLYAYLFYDWAQTVLNFVLMFYAAVLISPVYRRRLTPQHEFYAACRFRLVPCSPAYDQTTGQTTFL